VNLTWKQRLSGSVPDKLPPIGSYSGFTLDDWRHSIERITYFRGLMEQPMFRDLLAVLNNSRPKAALTNVQPTEAAVLLGMRQGYDQLLSVILSLGYVEQKVPDQVEADYGARGFEEKL
jgi:hypothetical protein